MAKDDSNGAAEQVVEITADGGEPAAAELEAQAQPQADEPEPEPDKKAAPAPAKRSSSMLVTSTGEHPVVVVRPSGRGKVVLGMVLDLVALLGILGLIYTGKVSSEAGLPWVALLLGIKAGGVARKTPHSAGAVMSLVGH